MPIKTMDKNQIRHVIFLIIAAVLIYSFQGHPSWVELCSGLAFFLFGMQCMTDGLQQLAGGKLEKLLAKSTAKRWKGLLFGAGSTIVLQSTTVVSLLIIAFINASLITLAGGFTIMLGAYIGSSSGVWLLALAGQSVSLSVLTYPLIVLGVLASFNGDKSKALGRVVIGIAFIFLAITHMKTGFSDVTTQFDFTTFDITGFWRFLILLTVGFLATMVLQSSHATIMLILTALDLSQITLNDAFILTIGALLGSTVSTSIIGFLGGSRDGKRLALAHLVFHLVIALVIVLILSPIREMIHGIGRWLDFNDLMQLALFHTLFNVVGVALFWGVQAKLLDALKRLIPDAEKVPLVVETAESIEAIEEGNPPVQSKYLLEASLSVPAAAMGAVFQEIRHLGEVSAEVVCLSLNISLEDVTDGEVNEDAFANSHDRASVDANLLYNHYVKGLYGNILIYMSRIHFTDAKEMEYYQSYLLNCQMVVLSMVDSVKSSRHLQKNFNRYLTAKEGIMHDFYQDLKLYLLTNLKAMYEMRKTFDEDLCDPVRRAHLLDEIHAQLDKGKQFERVFRHEIFIAGRDQKVNAFNTGSVMNDLSYCRRLVKSLFDIMLLTLESQMYPFANDDVEHLNKEIVDD
ncbi:Na/Pi cotransporter family protein [Wohlfahrtiimonas chitiniclastica]|uniref:Na/Pi cotransporter family protein n=1 Tax=Wohlfahrtiimonas chitiniclastica TaxID=400946 RepID=UPI001BCE30D1|nr:Na/Pi symporter [Wohlfahrtiimonas chitiniclastica]MBS7835384.1 Na/Pi cotransporter family protein [Wohlfahrtiimonas chitiniclastica]